MEYFRRPSAPVAMLLLAGTTLFALPSKAAEASDASALPAASPSPPATCGSFHDFISTNCPLTWYGITLYGTIDIGANWQSHGTSFNGTSSVGLEYLLSKNGNRSGFHQAPNQLSQSNIGIKGTEEFLPDWNFIFDLEAGFDPYSMRLADGPSSVRENAGVPLNSQGSNADSSRAGQFYNSLGYLGVSSPTYGTLTLFRQNSLTLDGVAAYDPLGASYAFSPIGWQGTACGGGDTEDCRFSTSVKYRVNYGPVRGAALYQFGGYGLNNAADGAVQLQGGGDIPNVMGGTISFDGIWSRVTDAAGVSLGGATTPPGPLETLTATVSDNTAWMALLRYTKDPVKLYGGYEWIRFGNPSDPKSSFDDIAGDFICLGCAANNNTTISNTTYVANPKHLQIFWVGGRYALTSEWTLMAGYYEYLQNNYGAGMPCANATKATCSGFYNAFSLAADWQFAAKFDTYAGFMYQTADGGLSSGFLHHDTIDPGVGLRFRF
jgi:predicted porin